MYIYVFAHTPIKSCYGCAPHDACHGARKSVRRNGQPSASVGKVIFLAHANTASVSQANLIMRCALLLATWLLRISRIRSKTTFKTFYFKPKMNSERMWCFAYMMKASELLSHHSAPQSKAVSVAGKMSIQLKTCAVYGSRGEHFFKPGEYGNPHTRVLPRAPRTW